MVAKMWKYTSEVSKVVDEIKNKNPLKAAHDTREYEKMRTTDVVKV